MVMYGPPVGSIASTSPSSPSFRTLMCYKLINVEKQLTTVRITASTRIVISQQDVKLHYKDRIEVDHLETIVSILRDRFRNLLTAEERQDEVVSRLCDLQSIYNQPDQLKSCRHDYIHGELETFGDLQAEDQTLR